MKTRVTATLRRSSTTGQRAKLAKDELEFVASTERMALDGFRIRKAAWQEPIRQFETGERIPKGLASHMHALPGGEVPTVSKPVAVWWEEGEGLIIRVKFAPKEVSELGPKYLAANRDGYMDAISVGWGDTQMAPEEDWEDRDVPEIIGLRWDEYSHVAVGADAGAVKRAKDAGFDDLVCTEHTCCDACATATREASESEEPTAEQTRGDEDEEDQDVVDQDAAEDEEDADADAEGDEDVEDDADSDEDEDETVEDEDGEPRGLLLTAAEVAQRAQAQRAAAGSDGQRSLGNIAGSGGIFWPTEIETLEPTLRADAYRVVWNCGVAFQPIRPNTDELYRFENSPMESVLAEIDEFWERASDYAKIKMLHKRGVLLEGPPGTGKTSGLHQASRLMADRGDVVFFADDIWVLRMALQDFREVEPHRHLVVILEDIDDHIHGHERDMLALLDGDQAIGGVLYLATTNYVRSFPPRLLRAGRFDRKVHVGPPSEDGRLQFLRQKLGEFEETAEIERLAGETEGYSFGDLRELVIAVYALKEPVADVLERLGTEVAARGTRQAPASAAQQRSAEDVPDAEARSAGEDPSFRDVLTAVEDLRQGVVGAIHELTAEHHETYNGLRDDVNGLPNRVARATREALRAEQDEPGSATVAGSDDDAMTAGSADEEAASAAAADQARANESAKLDGVLGNLSEKLGEIRRVTGVE